MAIFFPGSSEQTLVATTLPLTRVFDAELPALSLDETLPPTRPVDRIRLLLQSPRKLYLYWELARDPFTTLRQAIGADRASSYRIAARLTNLDASADTLYEADATRRAQWFDALPGHSYRADIGLFAPHGSFIRLLSSNTVRTPRTSVSPFAATTPEFRVTPMEFSRVLNEAGYAADALEVALEAADEATKDRATRNLFESLAGAEALAMDEFDVAELRAFIAALAFGTPLHELQTLLSTAFARWLAELSATRGETFDAARLLELLRSTLQFELSFDSFNLPTEDELRLAARFVWSASAVNLPKLPAHIWLPSMMMRFGRN